DPLDDPLRPRLVEVGRDDAGPLAGHRDGRRGADPRGRSRDHRDLAVESHRPPPRRPSRVQTALRAPAPPAQPFLREVSEGAVRPPPISYSASSAIVRAASPSPAIRSVATADPLH